MQLYWIRGSRSGSRLRNQARNRDVRRISSLRICAIASFGGDEFVASRDRREFVVAYSPEGDLFRTGFRIKAPDAVGRNQGDRERPVFRADIQCHRSVSIATKPVHLL